MFNDYEFIDAEGNVIFTTHEESLTNACIVFLNDCRVEPMDDEDALKVGLIVGVFEICPDCGKKMVYLIEDLQAIKFF